MLKAGSFINAEDAKKKTGFRANPVGKLVKRYPNKIEWDLDPNGYNGPKMTCDRAILNPQVFSGSVLGWVRGPLEISWMGWASWFVGDLGVFWSTLGCVDRSSLQKSWWLSWWFDLPQK